MQIWGSAMLILLLGALAAAEPTTNATATNADYAAGVALLAEKKAASAIVAFDRCLAAEPAGSAVAADCHWESGWAHYLEGDWARVVKHWEAVQAVDPERDGLDRYLSQARDNLGLDALLSKSRGQAPATFKSDVPEGTTVRLRAVGDLMIGTDFPDGYLPPGDGSDTFAGVTDWLTDADLTFGNLEGPVCDNGKTTKCKPNSKPGSCYAFRTPSKYAPLYKAAGFDLMSTANNHSGDFGQTCRLETEQHLDELGIAHSGRPGDIARLEVNGLKIAMIGFHTNRACHYVNDHETAAGLVQALTGEADLVIVSFHGGAEGSKALHVPDGTETFYGENRGHLRKFARVVIDAGADLVLGHGPHVLRGMEVYNDRLIAYSLGNFSTYGRFNLSGRLGIGAVLEVTMTSDGELVSGQVLPTKQHGEGVVAKDAEGEAIDLIRMLSEADFPGTAVRVAQDGTFGGPG